MKLYLFLAIILISGCAKNSRDVIEEGRPLGLFEPKRDYIVDVPMGEQQVVGKSSGVEILGFITLGAGNTAEGVSVGNRGDSTYPNSNPSNSSSGSVLANMALSAFTSTSGKFKKAALRDACEQNNCDVLGYTMYDVDEKNFFLWKTYNVKVKGFPGKVGKLENVQRKFSITDSYWRAPLPGISSY